MAKKKAMNQPVSIRQGWIKLGRRYSIRRQCRLAGISRTPVYYQPEPVSKLNLLLMRLIDEQYLQHPEYGSPRMTDWLINQNYNVNHKRVARLMRTMGLQDITPGPHTSKPAPNHRIYPYLLRNVDISRVGQVWSTDITYIPMQCGYMFLTAVIDWYSRYVLSWELSNSLESSFCVSALNDALDRYGNPEIFNTDQGSQYTSDEFTSVLLKNQISISMDGRGRALDNVFVERLWWTVKYEDVYPRNYGDGHKLYAGLDTYFQYYNHERQHSSLDKRTPFTVFSEGAN
jgi:putative transposase